MLKKEKYKFKSEREEQIYNLRNKGMTYTEISKIFRVTPPAIRQSFLRIERQIKDIQEAEKPNSLDLIQWESQEVRIKNGLKNLEITTIDELISLTPSDLLKVRNLGRICIYVIRSTLKRHGYKLKENKGT